MTDTDVPVVEISGLAICTLPEEDVVAYVIRQLSHGVGGAIFTPNLDILRQCEASPNRELLQGAQLLVPDGMPLVWALTLNGLSHVQRVTGSSLVWTLSSAAAKTGNSVLLLGGATGVADRAVARLKNAYPNLRIVGTVAPEKGFERDEFRQREVIDRVAERKPDIVFVGLGFPKQERLIREMQSVLPSTWFLGCGGAIDMLAGDRRRAPLILQRIGLEWVHRLALEPSRMYRRYLVDGLPYFPVFMLKAFVGAVKRQLSFNGTGADSTSPAKTDSELVTYLVSEYPAPSHAFVEREIAALRRAGANIRTVSVRKSAMGAAASAASSEASATTIQLKTPRSIAMLPAVFGLLASTPKVASVALALLISELLRTRRARQAAYIAEAVLVLAIMQRFGSRHLHVHFANNSAAIATMAKSIMSRAAPKCGWHWTLSMHGPTEFANPNGFDLVKKFESASAIACIGLYCAAQVQKYLPAEQWNKIGVVRMSVNANIYSGSELLKYDRPTRILFVGRLVAEKAPHLLLEAVELLARQGTAIEVTIAGDGALREETDSQADRLAKLGVDVRVLGAVSQDELPRWYTWCDIFCLPSYDEGIPVVLMEAMASRRPVVATKIAGIPELVANEESGLLVDSGDTLALAKALKRLCNDPRLAERLAEAGRQRVLTEFDPDVNARRLLDLFFRTHQGS